MLDKNGVAYAECVVGNIIGNHYWGQKKEIRSGTKQFKAGAKAYCVFMYGGMGHQQIRVLGKPRKEALIAFSNMWIPVLQNSRYVLRYCEF